MWNFISIEYFHNKILFPKEEVKHWGWQSIQPSVLLPPPLLPFHNFLLLHSHLPALLPLPDCSPGGPPHPSPGEHPDETPRVDEAEDSKEAQADEGEEGETLCVPQAAEDHVSQLVWKGDPVC